ncbi:MAG: antitoxin of toxin-antitoxin stability system [Methylibium sp.]|nr:antitoxin of toxin-antitoxin stability system [Methylibium sp.]
METTSQFVFRAPESFVRETAEAARLSGLSRSEYARRAIEEANARAMQMRMAALSRRLAGQTADENEALDGSAPDGLSA